MKNEELPLLLRGFLAIAILAAVEQGNLGIDSLMLKGSYGKHIQFINTIQKDIDTDDAAKSHTCVNGLTKPSAI